MTLQMAAKAFNAGDMPAAHQLCQQVLANDPLNPAAMNLMGALTGTAGRHDLAAEWMRKAVELNPRELSYRTNYVAALLRMDRVDDAATVVAQSLEVFPENAELLTLQGIVVGRQGDDDRALELLLAAIETDPNSSTAHFNLSVIYRRQHEEEKSLEHLQKAVELNPNNSETVNNLAGQLLKAGEFIDSLRYLQKYLELEPRSAQGYYNLSVALEAAGDAEQSIISLRNALKIDPSMKRARFKLINQLIARGHFDEAEQLMDQWESEEPKNPGLLSIKSRYLERKGDVEEARKVLDQVLEEDRALTAVRMSEATLLDVEGRPAEAAEVLEAIVEERDAEEADTDALDLLGVRFFLGKVYDSIGKHKKAFANYQIGNEARQKSFATPFDPEKSAQRFDEIAEIAKEGWNQREGATGYESNVPIFILGMPRSGTSLTEQIFGAHSQVHAAGELRTFFEAMKATHGSAAEVPAGKFEIIENADGFHSVISSQVFEPAALHKIGETYVDHVASIADGKPRVSDKMPFNYLFAPVIQSALPGAKIIHTRRNPLDTCVSCYFQNFANGCEFAFDLDHLGDYYANYLKVMDAWRELPVEMLEVDYEELVSDTEPVVRRMFDFCELEFEPACLDTHKNTRPVATASYQQVREPIYDKSVNRWKHYEKHIGPIIDALGLG